MNLPAVIPAGDRRWFVASKSNPGAYWPVVKVNIDGATVLVCPCPAGRVRAAEGITSERRCRHERLVVEEENRVHARPVLPPAISLLVE